MFNNICSLPVGGIWSAKNLKFKISADADRARKHGMEEYIAADPITMDHHDLFQELQRLSLDWRLEDPFASLVNYLLYILTSVWILHTSKAGRNQHFLIFACFLQDFDAKSQKTR